MAVHEPNYRMLSKAGNLAQAVRGPAFRKGKTAVARATWLAQFLEQARALALERGEELSEAELEREAGYLRAQYMADLGRRSVRTRRQKAASRKLTAPSVGDTDEGKGNGPPETKEAG